MKIKRISKVKGQERNLKERVSKGGGNSELSEQERKRKRRKEGEVQYITDRMIDRQTTNTYRVASLPKIKQKQYLIVYTILLI